MTQPEQTRCRHCGDPIRQGEGGDWAHVVGPGSILYNCQHTVPYGQVAEPPEQTPDREAQARDLEIERNALRETVRRLLPEAEALRAERDALAGQAARARHRALSDAWQAVDRAVTPLGHGPGAASNSPWNAGYEQAKNKALNELLALRGALSTPEPRTPENGEKP